MRDFPAAALAQDFIGLDTRYPLADGRITRRHYPALVASRDTGADPGRRMAEPRRRTDEGLVASNFRRAEEALRVLEEYGKVLAPAAAASFKRLRFEL